MKLVTRAEWGAREPKRRTTKELSDEPTCHWNGPLVTVAGQKTWDHSRCPALVRGIQNFHMDGNNWSDIAYNFLECPHGYTFEGRGLNVVNAANGTNIGNQSSHAIMCLAGEGNDFPESEKVGFKECIAYIHSKTKAPGTCKGHRDHHSTQCPGDARYSWVHQGMPTADNNEIGEEENMVGLGKVSGKPEMYMVYPTGNGEMVRKHVKTSDDFWMFTELGVIRPGQKCAELTGAKATAFIKLRQVD